MLNKYCSLFICLEDDVQVCIKNGALNFKDNTSSLNIPTVKEYDAIMSPDGTPEGSATVDMSEIKGLFKRVIFASSSEEVVYDYRAVLLECDNECMKAIACDRRVMAINSIKIGAPCKGSFRLPVSGINILTEFEGDLMTISFYKKAIGFSVSGEMMIDLYLPEYAESFPDYRSVISNNWRTFLRGKKEDFISVIDGPALSSELTVTMGFKHGYEKEPPKFFIKDPFGCSIRHEHSLLQWSGDELIVKVNRLSFKNAVRNTEGMVVVSFNNNKSIYSVSCDGADYRCYLMPYSPAEKR